MNKLNEVISKAIMDEDFRKSFLSDPMNAVEGFNLSEEEIAELKSIDLTELEQVNNEMEERLSKSFINLPDVDGDDDPYHSSHISGPSGGLEHGSHDNDHSSW